MFLTVAIMVTILGNDSHMHITRKEAEHIILNTFDVATSHMYISFDSDVFTLPSKADFFKVINEDKTDIVAYTKRRKCGWYAHVLRTEFLKRELGYCVGVAKVRIKKTKETHMILLWIDDKKQAHAFEPQTDRAVNYEFELIRADFLAY